jgi:hypothetical protein
MLFNRLAEAKVELLSFDTQRRFSRALAEVKHLRAGIQNQLRELELLPQRIIAQSLEG